MWLVKEVGGELPLASVMSLLLQRLRLSVWHFILTRSSPAECSWNLQDLGSGWAGRSQDDAWSVQTDFSSVQKEGMEVLLTTRACGTHSCTARKHSLPCVCVCVCECVRARTHTW